MKSLEQVSASPSLQDHLPKSLASHTLWVCFLNQEGYEFFTKANYTDNKLTVPHSADIPRQAEISTIQFWHDGDQVTILPTGSSDNGEILFTTVQQLVERGELPTLVIQSLKKRLKMQPYRHNTEIAIYPLIELLPYDDEQTSMKSSRKVSLHL